MSFLWVGIIVLAVLIDLFTSCFLFSGFAIGGIIALIMSILGVSSSWQVIAFSIIGILFIFTISPRIKKAIKKNEGKGVKTIKESFLGREIKVEKDIDEEEVIIIDGAYWTFKNVGEKIKKGDLIKVISIEGNKVIVKKKY